MMLASLAWNLRSALRIVWREPSFSASVIVTLALAIGASAAVFSFANTLLLKPFPFREPERLFEIYSVKGGELGKISMADVEEMRRSLASVEAIAAHTGSAGGYNYSGEGRPEEWKAILCTGNLFAVLGVPLDMGSPWPEDMDRNRGFRVILSHGVWQSNFAARTDILGKTITLDHAPGYQIHAVAPRGFDFPRGVQVFRSLGGFASYDKHEFRNVVAVARLKPGATEAQFRGELSTLAQNMASRFPVDNHGLSFSASSFFQIYSAPSRPFMLVLLAAVGLVLGMACLNAANLLLVRSFGRHQDLTVRFALGARRTDVAVQHLAESIMLALFASALGLFLARWWMKILYSLIADRLPAWMTIDLDIRVLSFTFVITVLSSVAAALLPILTNTSQIDLASRIRQGGRSLIGSSGTGLLRDALIGAQVAMAVVLLTGAALLIHSFMSLQNQKKGFSAQSISTFRVALGWKRYSSQDRIADYYEKAQRQLAARPEFSAVAFGHAPPLTGQENERNQTILVQGQSLDESQNNPFVQLQTISENYLAVLGIRLLEGRAFTSFDRKEATPVAIISKRLANRLFPNSSAIGQRIALNVTASSAPVFREIVGVAESTQREPLATANSQDVLLPYRQVADPNNYFLIRTTLPSNEFQQLVEQTLWSIDSQQSLFDVRTYQDRILDGIWQLRLSQYLLVIFGGVALALASIGIYSMMSYFVAMQRRELGVRLALGAQPSVVRWFILGRSGRIVASGIAAGLAFALAFAQALASQIPQIDGLNPAAYSGATILVAITSLLAAFIPAWQASRVDPMIALRGD